MDGAEVVILGIDANQNMYEGPLAEVLRREPLGMMWMPQIPSTEVPNWFQPGLGLQK